MDNLFAIHGDSSIFAVVKAKSEEEAYDIFVRNSLGDEVLIEYINSFAVNDGLMEDFCCDEQGYFYKEDDFEYVDRILAMTEEEQEEYIEFNIKKNIDNFWSNTPQFAEEYYRELQKAWESEYEHEPNFTEDFYVETIKKIFNNGSWFNEFRIIRIDLNTKDYQLIFEE